MPDREEMPGPILAEREAIEKVGKGLSARVAETVDTTGKIIAAIAGLGVFFFATGYFVEWQRLKRGGLPPEQILPLMPKAQIAAAGVRELAISILLGGSLLALLGVGLVAVVRATQGRTGAAARLLNRVFEKEVAVPTILIGAFTLLIVPFDSAGIAVAAIITAVLGYGLYLVHRFLAEGDGAKFPLWRLSLAIALAAAILSGVRQHEFPESRPLAVARLKDGKTLEATYVASDSDKVMFRLRQRGSEPELIVLRGDELEKVRFWKNSYVYPVDESLLDTILKPAVPGFELSCIPPECRWDQDVRVGPSSFF